LLLVRVAWPPDTLPVPIESPLSKNVTVPVSPEPDDGATVAVNVTDWPNVDGLVLPASASVVVACETDTGAETVVELDRNPGPPPKAAEIESLPTGSVVIDSDAVVTPAVVIRGAEPTVVDPLSVNVTVPVGFPTPEVGATVAVSVTSWPKFDEGVADTVVKVGRREKVSVTPPLDPPKLVSPT
jgi:hypothetical protein